MPTPDFRDTSRDLAPTMLVAHLRRVSACQLLFGFGYSRAFVKAERNDKMKKWGIAFVATVLFVAWYEFRPERLFINQSVHEELPPTEGGSLL